MARHEVLALYRRVFRLAQTWQAQSGQASDTQTEKIYIEEEARTLFRKNKQLQDLGKIRSCIEECETRIELALHYKIPYPRPMNVPHTGLAGASARKLRTQERLRKRAKPIYLQSQEDT
uniref:LYR motif-containing protein 1 n=1 Tax=Myxine glutinosa TaxID=7769 RepID=UPI0035901FB2